jgi:hypothetical protein
MQEIQCSSFSQKQLPGDDRMGQAVAKLSSLSLKK